MHVSAACEEDVRGAHKHLHRNTFNTLSRSAAIATKPVIMTSFTDPFAPHTALVLRHHMRPFVYFFIHFMHPILLFTNVESRLMCAVIRWTRHLAAPLTCCIDLVCICTAISTQLVFVRVVCLFLVPVYRRDLCTPHISCGTLGQFIEAYRRISYEFGSHLLVAVVVDVYFLRVSRKSWQRQLAWNGRVVFLLQIVAVVVRQCSSHCEHVKCHCTAWRQIGDPMKSESTPNMFSSFADKPAIFTHFLCMSAVF